MKKLTIKILSYFLYKIVIRELANATLMDSKGNFIKPFNPNCKEIDLEVVAVALSRIKRFFGQTKLSVAQHSVNMAKIFMYLGQYEFAKQALLHEISEAFMGDLASPLKKAFPLFKEIEESLIKKTFLCYSLSYPMAQEVHKLDKSIVLNEAMKHMPNKKFWKKQGTPVDKKLLKKAGVDMEAWSEEKSYKEFMSLVKELKIK